MKFLPSRWGKPHVLLLQLPTSSFIESMIYATQISSLHSSHRLISLSVKEIEYQMEQKALNVINEIKHFSFSFFKVFERNLFLALFIFVQF